MVEAATTKKTKTTQTCPVCNHRESEVLRVGVREDPTEKVYRCSRCRLEFLQRPKYDLREYYREQYRESHSYVVGESLNSRKSFDLMRPHMGHRVKLFKEMVPKGAIVLEIGCASGYFLDAIRDEYSVYGSEWNPEDAAFVRDELGIPCEEGDLDDIFPGQKFTAICGFQVLEHVADPVGWLRLIKKRLIGGGWIHIEVPNAESALVSLYDMPDFNDFWYRAPHLQLFNMQNLAILLGSLGFEAQIRLRQEYSLANAFHWMMTGKPQKDFTQATSAMLPVSTEHPAHAVVNRFFGSIDRQYRSLMDTTKAADRLVAAGRKREV